MAAKLLEFEELDSFLAHTATIRSTFALTHFEDARVFLLEEVCQQANRIGPHFQRPIAVGGLRFTLPETDEYPGNIQVNIESFRQSRSEVYVEVKGIFAQKKVTRTELDVVLDHVRGVRSFITERVFPYLDQYDLPAGDEE